MKKLLFTLLLLPSLAIAQVVVFGRVTDTKTGDGIAYVNIGIVGKNKGTVSDIKGQFSLSISDSLLDDSLKFSMAGYLSKSFKVSDFTGTYPNPVNVKLEAAVIKLEEFQVYSTKLKEKILGNKTESMAMRAGFSSNELGNEVGIPIKKGKNPIYIQEVRVFIAENLYDTLKFRINIYKMNKGLPGEKILNHSVIAHTTLKKGRLTVDLKKYNIVAHEDIFVAIEWIENLGKEGLYFSASFNSKGLLARHTSQGNWEKVGPISLGISIRVLQ